MLEEADHRLFTYAAQDLPDTVATHEATLEPGKAFACCK